jgi:hypothetical protein
MERCYDGFCLCHASKLQSERLGLRFYANINKGFGQFAGALVMLIVTQGFKESLKTSVSYAKCSGVCHLAVDKMWRVLIGKLLLVASSNVLLTCMNPRLWCCSRMHCSLLSTHNSRNASLYLRCSTRCGESRRRCCSLYARQTRR